MDYFYLFIGAVIVICCFYFIIAPFFNTGGGMIANTEGNSDLSLEMIYEAVNELEMDYLMKKISKEDFEVMKKRYQAMAAGYLTQDTTMKGSQSKKETIDEKVEREIIKELNKLRKQNGGVG